MTHKSLLVFKWILFLFGAGIIFLVFMLNSGGLELTRNDAFIWASIALMYLIVFLPLFFSSIRIGNFSEKIPSLVLVWTGVALYVPASIVVIVLLVKGIASFNVALIIQAILVFLFALDIYFGFFSILHVFSVEQEEAGGRQYLTEIKSKALSLSLAAGALPVEYENAQKNLKQALDDIRYISPLRGSVGTDFETKIISVLDSISRKCEAIGEGARVPSFDKEVSILQVLVKGRRLLRN